MTMIAMRMMNLNQWNPLNPNFCHHPLWLSALITINKSSCFRLLDKKEVNNRFTNDSKMKLSIFHEMCTFGNLLFIVARHNRLERSSQQFIKVKLEHTSLIEGQLLNRRPHLIELVFFYTIACTYISRVDEMMPPGKVNIMFDDF